VLPFAELTTANIRQDRMTVISYSSLGAEDFGARLTDDYDVVDVHFMPGVIHDKKDEKSFPGVPFDITRFPGGNVPVFEGSPGAAGPQKFDFAAFSRAWDSACRRHYAAMLQRTRNYHQAALTRLTLPSGKKLVAVVTESFGPCIWPDHPAVSWDWYRRYQAGLTRIWPGGRSAATPWNNGTRGAPPSRNTAPPKPDRVSYFPNKCNYLQLGRSDPD